MKQSSTDTVLSACTSDNEVVQVLKAWMLDVDGVLISLLSKRVEEHLIESLAHRLILGEPITFHSGRSPLFIAELILSLLEPWIADRTQRSRVMAAGEKRGSWANYTPEGTLHVAFDTALVVSSLLKKAMNTQVGNSASSDLMNIEGGKRTMMSIIKRRDILLDVFQQTQTRFVRLAQKYLADLCLNKAWKVNTVSDTPKTNTRARAKAHRILHWLQCNTFRASSPNISSLWRIACWVSRWRKYFTGTIFLSPSCLLARIPFQTAHMPSQSSVPISRTNSELANI